jgi:SAM-dependent methyltransferase
MFIINFERDYYEQITLWEKDFFSIPAEHERIVKTIEFIPIDVQTILDVGCGNGAFLNKLPERYRIVGLDFSWEALKYVKNKAIYGNIAVLPFKSESFDLVTCLEVLEHLPLNVFEKALFEIQRVSKKYIIVSVPNDEDLDFALVICPICRCWYHPSRHVRSFNPERLKTLFVYFELSRVEEIGPLELRPRYNRFLYAAYRLWKNVSPPSTAICPQCGYSPAGELGSLLFSYLLKLFRPFAKIIWHPRQCRRWLLALYVRKNS